MNFMKKSIFTLFALCMLFQLQATESTESSIKTEIAENYIIVVGQFPSESNAKELLSQVKKEFKDAGVFYDEVEKKHYVYIETYYAKSGADYAVWWLKKNRPSLPKVWSKTIVTK